MVARKIKREMDKIFQKENLSGAQAFAIHFICEKTKEKRVYAKDLEKEFDTRRASMAELIHTMEKNDLLERKKEETDSRKKEIILTKKALEKEVSIGKEIQKLEKKLIRNLTKEEKRKLFEILEKIEENLV